MSRKMHNVSWPTPPVSTAVACGRGTLGYIYRCSAHLPARQQGRLHHHLPRSFVVSGCVSLPIARHLSVSCCPSPPRSSSRHNHGDGQGQREDGRAAIKPSLRAVLAGLAVLMQAEVQ